MKMLMSALVLLLAGGCQPGAETGTLPTGAPDPGPPLVVVGARVASVDETERDPQELADAVEGDAVLVTTQEAADGLAAALDRPAVAEVDLTTHLLVAGGYPRCTEESRILFDGYRTPHGLSFSTRETEPGTVCAWSPFTVDVWAVPLAAVGDEVPELVPGPPQTA